jgi:hypothetical protein
MTLRTQLDRSMVQCDGLTAMAVLCGLQMSVFLVAALNSLGMGATLIALSVVALDAWGRGGLMGKAYAPVIHAGAALLVSQGSSLLVDAPRGVHMPVG